ncbi:hypothetical protein SELMODRAFT_412061 [Selaginella moellendorffii]|uniref:Integrase core domain-containing protein n=1 Tax=Selaginella moellendorffii TaxID=88036 RepID=D8RJX9_SELML|nr:hypothetical protein SELMODRAFT_412061 [Selaginella moellendorffii]
MPITEGKGPTKESDSEGYVTARDASEDEFTDPEGDFGSTMKQVESSSSEDGHHVASKLDSFDPELKLGAALEAIVITLGEASISQKAQSIQALWILECPVDLMFGPLHDSIAKYNFPKARHFTGVAVGKALLMYSGLLEDVEEDKVDGLPSNFSDSDYGSSMDSDNDALLEILETKTAVYLACYLRISKPTLYKYMWLADPNWRGVYYRVPPEEVFHHVQTNNAMNQGGTNWGIINSRSSCRTRGYWFSRCQIREALATHDPSRLEQKHMTRIRQQIYRNEEAYALYHMDSYCKLVSYSFYVHAIICGATHYIVACKLATSKESHAIFNTYAQAVRQFGRPKHIRSDNAPEHNEVEKDMIRY